MFNSKKATAAGYLSPDQMKAILNTLRELKMKKRYSTHLDVPSRRRTFDDIVRIYKHHVPTHRKRYQNLRDKYEIIRSERNGLQSDKYHLQSKNEEVETPQRTLGGFRIRTLGEQASKYVSKLLDRNEFYFRELSKMHSVLPTSNIEDLKTEELFRKSTDQNKYPKRALEQYFEFTKKSHEIPQTPKSLLKSLDQKEFYVLEQSKMRVIPPKSVLSNLKTKQLFSKSEVRKVSSTKTYEQPFEYKEKINENHMPHSFPKSKEDEAKVPPTDGVDEIDPDIFSEAFYPKAGVAKVNDIQSERALGINYTLVISCALVTTLLIVGIIVAFVRLKNKKDGRKSISESKKRRNSMMKRAKLSLRAEIEGGKTYSNKTGLLEELNDTNYTRSEQLENSQTTEATVLEFSNKLRVNEHRKSRVSENAKNPSLISVESISYTEMKDPKHIVRKLHQLSNSTENSFPGISSEDLHSIYSPSLEESKRRTEFDLRAEDLVVFWDLMHFSTNNLTESRTDEPVSKQLQYKHNTEFLSSAEYSSSIDIKISSNEELDYEAHCLSTCVNLSYSDLGNSGEQEPYTDEPNRIDAAYDICLSQPEMAPGEVLLNRIVTIDCASPNESRRSSDSEDSYSSAISTPFSSDHSKNRSREALDTNKYNGLEMITFHASEENIRNVAIISDPKSRYLSSRRKKRR